MTIQVFGPDATVSFLNRAFTDTSPANAIYKNQVTRATSIGDAAFANEFAASWAGTSNAALSKLVLTNMGILPTTDTSVAALEQALTDYFAAFGVKTTGTNGQVTADTRGLIVYQLSSIISGLETNTGALAVYNAAAVAWNTEVAASYTYSSNAANTTPTQSGTTGQSLSLSTNQDNIMGGTGDDTINGPAMQVGSGTLANTLQGVDTIDGGAGKDTLNVTLSEGGINATVTPSMKNVETVAVRFTNAAAVLDLGSSTGATAIAVANSTTAGALDNIGDIAALSIKNQSVGLAITNTTAGSATTMAFDFNAVGTKTASAVNTVTLDLGNTNASKVTTANVTTNNSYVNIDSTAADVITTATVAATGTNTLLFTDSQATLTKITVTGDGSVDLMGGGITVPVTGVALVKLTTLDASALKGAVKAEITNAAKAVTITTGAGNDYIKAPTVATAGTSANMGAGNDTLIVGANLAAFDKSNGGDGTDIINITAGATLTSTTAKTITNFETLDISGSTGGTFDLSLNNFPTVQVDEAIAGVLTGAPTLSKAPDAFGLTLISKAKTGADFALGQKISVTGKDFAGTTAAGDAETFTLIASLNDDNKSGVANGNIVTSEIEVGTNAAADYVENVVIQATATKIDGGTTDAANKTTAYLLTPKLKTYGTETITIKGDASVDFASSAIAHAATYSVSKIDASASTGNITIPTGVLGTAVNSISYTGSAGVDTYTASAKGDMIFTGKGGDVVTLTAGAVRDTLVFKAATDSQLTDVSKDGKVTLTGDGVGVTGTTMDNIATFKTAADAAAAGDRIDLTNFSFASAQRGVEDVTSKVTVTTDLTSVTGFFGSVAGARGAAFAYVGADAYVFVDGNKDGNFTAADDLIIKLTGVTVAKGIAEADFNF